MDKINAQKEKERREIKNVLASRAINRKT